MNITIFQQSTLGIDDSRFALFCAKLQKHTLVVLGEYVLNPFFESLKKVPKDQIAKHSLAQIQSLQKLSKTRSLSFLAPIIMLESDKLLKQIVYICGDDMSFYTQQRLIAYGHWNEARFFGNPKARTLKEPMIFECHGLKIAALFGFEIHFDEIWIKIRKQKVDLVLLPCANTFDSHQRWRELCKMRAFLNGCALIRVNRVGESVVKGVKWRFYGDSLIAMPDGNIIDSLQDKEEMLSIEIHKQEILKMALEWGFREKDKKSSRF